MRKYTVGYFECKNCGSLQSDVPHWLDEAYRVNLAALDTGAAQRCLANWGLTVFVARLFSSRSAIDWGGGDGLLCRLLRDVGLDCRVHDAHAALTYGQGFAAASDETFLPDLVTAFEVVEHLTDPKSELPAVFLERATVVLLSTGTYRGQGESWWYLAPETGQHVFFYSERALLRIAADNQRRLWLAGDYALFVPEQKVTRLKQLVLFVLFRPRAIRLLRVLVTMLPTPGVWADYLKMRSTHAS